MTWRSQPHSPWTIRARVGTAGVRVRAERTCSRGPPPSPSSRTRREWASHAPVDPCPPGRGWYPRDRRVASTASPTWGRAKEIRVNGALSIGIGAPRDRGVQGSTVDRERDAATRDGSGCARVLPDCPGDGATAWIFREVLPGPSDGPRGGRLGIGRRGPPRPRHGPKIAASLGERTARPVGAVGDWRRTRLTSPAGTRLIGPVVPGLPSLPCPGLLGVPTVQSALLVSRRFLQKRVQPPLCYDAPLRPRFPPPHPGAPALEPLATSVNPADSPGQAHTWPPGFTGWLGFPVRRARGLSSPIDHGQLASVLGCVLNDHPALANLVLRAARNPHGRLDLLSIRPPTGCAGITSWA